MTDAGSLPDIDFGFLLSNSPGSLGFEAAPFKLPQDYIDILGGFEGEKYAEFKALFKRSFRDARKHAERIITLVELMQKGQCFSGPFASLGLMRAVQIQNSPALPMATSLLSNSESVSSSHSHSLRSTTLSRSSSFIQRSRPLRVFTSGSSPWCLHQRH